MAKYIGEGGKNPWGLRITPYQQGLADVTPEQVEHWSGPGLEEAQAKFSEVSQNTSVEHKGVIYSGGDNPYLFSKSAKTDAAKNSGIPELVAGDQVIHYQTPAASAGIAGCNTCGFETAGCSEACFAHGGQLGLPTGHVARLARTQFAFLHPDMFLGVAKAEIGGHVRRAINRGDKPIIRFGGTNEGLIHLMKSSEAIMGAHPEASFIEYSKAQSRDVVPKNKLIVPNHPNLTLATSVTENTTVPRMIQASEEQGQVLATPYFRKPHARYPESAVMVDKQGRKAEFPIQIDPSTRNSSGHGESLGDTSDDRSLDETLSGIRGGVLPLGGKKVFYTNEEGAGKAGVVGAPFIREFNPSRQASAFEQAAMARELINRSKLTAGETTPVSIGRGSRRGAAGF